MEEMCFCCPLCGGPLARQEHRAVCPQGHSFDVARQGYVNLLTVGRKHSRQPGDSPTQLAARRAGDFFSRYRPLAAASPRAHPCAVRIKLCVFDCFQAANMLYSNL